MINAESAQFTRSSLVLILSSSGLVTCHVKYVKNVKDKLDHNELDQIKVNQNEVRQN